ncbi:MAG: GntR family transcriptional regulator [Bacteroidetes bacterium]|nr:MAG: GntR family transcriptional regulator [Bacteroidota bacterium]
MIEIGKYNLLTILRQTSVGLYLGDNDGEDVLLPNKYCPDDFEINDKIEVFVYLDYAERKIATNINPKIYLHEFALLEVTDVTDVGAFLDWGLEKELLVPFREQKQKMEEGRWYIVYLDLDTKTNRLFASNKVNKYLDNETLTIEPGEEVDLLIFKKTDLGFSAIINNKHKGLIFSGDIFTELNIGEKIKGYIKNIRPDNKIDLSLQPIGYKNYKDINSQLIYNKLIENNNFLPVTDKSSPDEIYSIFGISKKVFKKSIGDLYKQKKIIILPNGIKLQDS